MLACRHILGCGDGVVPLVPAGLPGQHVHLELVHVHVVGGDAAVGDVVGGGLNCARDELLVLWPLPGLGLLAAVRAI